MLGNKVLTAIGVRSYGIYLWHWPLFMITRPDLDLPFHGYGLLIGRFVVTGILAELSYRFVEIPIRQGAIGRWSARYRAAKGELRASMMKKAMLGGAAATLFCLVIVGRLRERQAGTPRPTASGSTRPRPPPSRRTAARSAPRPKAPAPATTVPTTTTTGATDTGATTTPGEPRRRRARPPPRGHPGAAALHRRRGHRRLGHARRQGRRSRQRMPGITVDAAVNRQVKAGADVAASMHSQGLITRAAVIHLGTNGVTTQAQFDQLMGALSGVPKIVLINTKVPRPWEDRVNGFINDTAKKYPNVVFVDWKAQSSPNKDWFWNDGIHLRPKGAAAFAEIIAQAVG